MLRKIRKLSGNSSSSPKSWQGLCFFSLKGKIYEGERIMLGWFLAGLSHRQTELYGAWKGGCRREGTDWWLIGWLLISQKTGRLLKFCYYDHYMIIIRSLLLLCFWWWWWCWWWWWVWLWLLLSFLYYEQAHSVVWQFFGPEMLTYEGHLCIAMVRGCITIRSFHIAMEHDDLHCYTH